MIDLTGSCNKINGANTIVSIWKQIIEALFKLLKISGSIDTILFGDTKIFNSLSEDFCKSIGDSMTIKHLNFDQPVGSKTGSNSVITKNLLKGVAMNAYKKGHLSSLSLKRCIGININDLV